jgi:hypothetical protein
MCVAKSFEPHTPSHPRRETRCRSRASPLWEHTPPALCAFPLEHAPCEVMQRSMVCLLLLVRRTNAKRMPVAVMPDNPNPDASRWHGTISTHCYSWCYVTADLTAIHHTSTTMQGTAVPHPLRILSGSCPPRHRLCRRSLHPTACTQAAGGIAVSSRWIVAFATAESDMTWQA